MIGVPFFLLLGTLLLSDPVDHACGNCFGGYETIDKAAGEFWLKAGAEKSVK